MISRPMKLFAFLLLFAPNIVCSAHDQSSAGSPVVDDKCLMPEPDKPPLVPVKPAKGSTKTNVAAAAKNASDKITVSVSKPFPKCAAELSSIDPKSPLLSANGYADASSKPKLGSSSCLLAGVVNGAFNDCDPQKKKSAVSGGDEGEPLEIPLDYAIINLVRWSVVAKQPVKASSWYLYDRHSGSTKKWRVSDDLRMLGSSNVGFVAVHFGIDDTCGIDYSVQAKQRTATNIANLQQLTALISKIAGGPDLSGISSNASKLSTISEPEQDNALANFIPQDIKSALASKEATTANGEEFENLLKEIQPFPAYTAEIQVLDDSKQPDIAKTRANLGDFVEKFPSSKITDIVAAHGAKSMLKSLPAPLQTEPGVGVYGFTTFKGIEKLPYDLTLTGKPGRTPRPVTTADTGRVSSTLVTANALARERPRLVKREDSKQIPVSWDNEEVPVTCAPAADTGVTGTQSASYIAPVPNSFPRQTYRMKESASPASKDSVRDLYRPAVMRALADRNEGASAESQAGSPPPSDNQGKKPNDKQPAKSDQPKDDLYTSQQTYRNEGLYRWDVSIGVTAFTAQKNSFNASDGTVHKSASRPENVYAFFDFFPWKTDLVKPPAFRWPSISAGLPAGSQPLNRATVGSSLGFNLWGFHVSPFAGVLFLREFRPKTLAIGSKATDAQLKSDLIPHRNYRVFVSVNFSVKDAANLIKNKGSNQSSSTNKNAKQSNQKSGSGN